MKAVRKEGRDAKRRRRRPLLEDLCSMMATIPTIGRPGKGWTGTTSTARHYFPNLAVQIGDIDT